MNPIKLVVKLTEEEPLVEVAENDLNYRMKTYQLSLPTDPLYARQWHLHTHLVNEAFDSRASSRCEEAWQLLHHFGNSDVVIGITDDGCKLDHLDFDAPGKFASWGYFRGERLVTEIDIDADREMYQSGSNHGTSCAGVIAGEVDAVLTVGAAPGCRLLPIQWESSGVKPFISDSKVMTALNYVADKVDVLSNSWGSVPTTLWSTLVRNRITDLAQSGEDAAGAAFSSSGPPVTRAVRSSIRARLMYPIATAGSVAPMVHCAGSASPPAAVSRTTWLAFQA